MQDLEASVRNDTWATQSHNEQVLNSAFQEAENVYLIFSPNKAGEYFGYARMASPISRESFNLGSSVETDEAKLAGTPQSIPTPATETAPKGRIIDDLPAVRSSGRPTCLTRTESPIEENVNGGNGKHWGRQFKIEWLSTLRLPFFRT